MNEQSPEPTSSSNSTNTQIPASSPPMQSQGDQFHSPMGHMNQGQHGGPIRVQPMQQVRTMPYVVPQSGQQQQQQQQPQPQQMRTMQQPNPSPHFSPMNQQNQMGQNSQPIPIQSRPQMPPNPPHSQQGPSMGMNHMPGPSHMQGNMPMNNQSHQMMQQAPSSSHHPQQSGNAPQFNNGPMAQQNQPTTTKQVNATTTGCILEKSKLDELMMQINKNTVLEESVKDALVEYADDFVTTLIDKVCRLIKSRGSKKIEGRDVEFVLKNVYNMPVVPRAAVHIFGAPETIDLSREKNLATDAHKQRILMLKKQLRKI